MYPGQRFIPKGVGVRSLTPEGYAAAFDAIMPAAEHLVKQNVDAIMVIGTSLTFYRGPEAHDRLLEKLRATTGLPVIDHEPGDPRRPEGGRRQTRRRHNRLHRRRQPAAEGAAGRGRLRGAVARSLPHPRIRRALAHERGRHHRPQRQVGGERRPAPTAWSSPAAGCARSASTSRWKTATGCRSSPRRRPRSGRRCGWSAKAAMSPATAGCWNRRRPLCIRADCAWTSARPHAFWPGIASNRAHRSIEAEPSP